MFKLHAVIDNFAHIQTQIEEIMQFHLIQNKGFLIKGIPIEKGCSPINFLGPHPGPLAIFPGSARDI